MSYPPPPASIVPVTGHALAPFEPLLDVFGRIVASQGQGGAALTIYHHGVPVVDLVGGEYRADSLQLVFSVSKSVTAIAAAIAHEEGLLDLDAPLADYWPAFARPSTRTITARSVLSHRSGLAALDRRLSLEEVLAGKDEEAIETQEPYWEPGTDHGYHPFTFGVLMNGVFTRTLGATVGDFVAQRLSAPLDLDLWIGVPDAVLPRVERIHYASPRVTSGRAATLAAGTIPGSTTGQLFDVMDIYNHPDMLRACWPSSSGVAGARDLARLFAATLGEVDGVRLLDEQTRLRMTTSLSRGRDRVLGIPIQFGSGVQLEFPQFPMLGARSYGHEAAGGSIAFADDEFDIAVGFTTNVFPSMAGASAGFLALLPTLRHCLTAESATR